jgi:flavodoxin I
VQSFGEAPRNSEIDIEDWLHLLFCGQHGFRRGVPGGWHRSSGDFCVCFGAALARSGMRYHPQPKERCVQVQVIYATDNGNTQNAATQIASKLGATATDIASASKSDLEGFDLLILGTPTYGFGDLQSDWEQQISLLKEVDLKGKKVALFGLGDQASYNDTFVDGMGLLYDAVTELGATVVGATSTEGYDFSQSHAVRDGKFVGLALDEDNQSDETEQRIDAWVAQLA